MGRPWTLFDADVVLRTGASAWLGAFRTRPRQTTDIFLCIVDHFEPQHGHAAQGLARQRLEDWLVRYRAVAERHRDAEGAPPAHSFFYPWDEFDEWEFTRLSELCSEGLGEIELHLHHRDDTESSLRATLREAVNVFAAHGALCQWPDGRPAFAFIHGNWALNNSCCQEPCNWCGVNDELSVLSSEGCYADFTFPAWRQPSQPRQVNAIYCAKSRPDCPKGHDRGTVLRAGYPLPEGLLMVQGSLTPYARWHDRHPKLCMDDGDLAVSHRYSTDRLHRWVRHAPRIPGRPDRAFVKLFCHGAPEGNREALLGGDLQRLFTDAEALYNDGHLYSLHYVSAREMANVIWATVEQPGLPVQEARRYRLDLRGSGRTATRAQEGAPAVR